MRRPILIALLVVLALFAASCGDGDTDTTAAGTDDTTAATETTVAAAADDGVLNVVRFESFDGWNLDGAAAYSDYQTHFQVMEGLLRFTSDGKDVEAGLADNWVWDPDALTWTFTLREDATFSNGDPVTWEDVAFSLSVWQEGANFGGSYASIIGVSGEGKTVVFELIDTDITLLPFLAASVSGVMPKDFAGMTQDEFLQNPIGAGAYQIDEWSVGGTIELSANPHFYDPDRPYYDKVIIETVPDETERQILFEGGDADIVEYLSPTVAPQYDPANVVQVPVHSVEHIGLNVLRPPFDDPLARQAVAYAIDYEAITAGLAPYFGLPSGILAPNIQNWAPPTKPYYRQDLAMAKDLLAQSTVPDGATVEFIYDVGNDLDTLIGQIIQANLAEIGFDVTLSGLETGAFLDRAFSIDADITVWNYGAVSPDISDPVSWVAVTGWLFSGYETDTLWDDFFTYAVSATPEEAQAVIAKIQDGAIDEAAAIAVAEGTYLHAVNPSLTGFASAPWGLHYYDTVAPGS
ncbi:MAG: ABC transporter substrate-binding protein [Acidimicrobiia bacterium]